MTFDPKSIPQRLLQAYQQGRAAVFVGAGASMGAGLPNWGGLLERMITAGEQHQVIDPSRAAQYRSLISDPGKYLLVASGLKDDLRAHFDEFITETFIDSKPKPTDLHRALVKLDQLKFVITTNYDTIIERAYISEGEVDVTVLTFKNTGELQNRLYKRDFFILKAHGDGKTPGDGIILTERDYREIIHSHRAYQSMLTAMFTMFSIVFVGASMTDPEMRLLLNYIADAFGQTSGPKHYAVMSEDQITQVEKERWFKDLNVQLIPVSPKDDYQEITEFLQALGAA